MQRIKQTLLCLGLIYASFTGVLAQDAVVAPDRAQVNHTLLTATSSYEDMIGPAVSKSSEGIAMLLADADKQANGVNRALPADAAKQFDGFLQNLHKAVDSTNYLAIAENAVAIFHLLVDNLKADALSLPKEVDLLDYAGYQLQVLAAEEKPDWHAMSPAAADADAWWNAIAKSRVTNRPLRDVVTTAIKGIKQATAEKNLGMVKLAAQFDLDLVDLLEGSIKKTSVPAPGSKTN
ncbi:MAG TPA: hypothetical protein VIK53_03975 [Verrucomicrobiae bacterium]